MYVKYKKETVYDESAESCSDLLQLDGLWVVADLVALSATDIAAPLVAQQLPQLATAQEL